ncbi:MAG TPA: TonB family protein [Opitutaceae bacterium]
MRTRILNSVSLLLGGGFTLCIFFAISIFLQTQEKAATPTVTQDDLEIVPLVMPPPPPPPRFEEKPLLVPELTEAIPLGLQEEPSTSTIKIAPSPPSIDEVLPPSHLPPNALADVTGLDSTLKPQMNVLLDDSHIYQKSEVDKIPTIISRSVPDVAESLLGASRARSAVVLFIVDTHGVVGNVRIVRTSGNVEFDSIMVDWVLQWTFTPATKMGKAVRCMVQQQVTVQMGHRDAFSL